MVKDKFFRNLDTNEIVSAYKEGYDFCLSSYKSGERGNRTAHPRKIPKDDIILVGIDLLENDYDYEEVR